MATRRITTRLDVALENEQKFKSQMTEVNGELRNLRSEVGLLEEEFRGQNNTVEYLTKKDQLLREEVEQQTEKVRALEEAVKDAAVAYGDTDKETDKLRQSLNRAKTDLLKMNRELEDTDKYLDEAKSSADGTAKSIDGFGREVKDSSGFLSDFTGGLADLKKAGSSGDLTGFVSSLGTLKNVVVGGAVVAGLGEIKDAIFEIVDGTEEYRKIMGTLEVSSEAAGYSAEDTAELYGRLYGVLGDTQTAATAAANLQAIGAEQETLMAITDNAIGAWATYGDSIPIDSLAESIDETIRSGEVTGALADVLNWGAEEGETYGVKLKEANDANKEWNEAVSDAKTAEDYFNLALQDCQTEAERTDLLLQAMSKQGLAEVGQAWLDVNDDIVKANDAQAKWDEQMAKLGETLSPAKDALINFGADALEFVNGLLEGAIGLVQDLISWLDKIPDDQKVVGYDPRDTLGNRVNGSHAGGLDRVPYDGYVAELHKDEAVLTKEEAAVWHALSAGPPAASQGVTAQELQQVTAAAVNAINLGGSKEPIIIHLTADVDSSEFYRRTITVFRDVDKANPEVTDDR